MYGFFKPPRSENGGWGDIPRQVLGTEACCAQWAKQAGGASGIARSSEKSCDYASSQDRQP